MAQSLLKLNKTFPLAANVFGATPPQTRQLNQPAVTALLLWSSANLLLLLPCFLQAPCSPGSSAEGRGTLPDRWRR